MNLELQNYRGLPIRLINRPDYKGRKAKRFVINDTNQNIWIPNQYLEEDGTLKENANLDWLFFNAKTRHKIAIAYGRVKK